VCARYWGVVGLLLFKRVLLRLVYFVSLLDCVCNLSVVVVLDGFFWPYVFSRECRGLILIFF
jgi:hypothetical protein